MSNFNIDPNQPKKLIRPELNPSLAASLGGALNNMEPLFSVKPEDIQNQSPVEIMGGNFNTSKKAVKTMQHSVLGDMANYSNLFFAMESPDYKAFATQLSDIVSESNTVNPAYTKKLLDAVSDVAALFDGFDGSSKEKIEAGAKQLKAKLDKNDELYDFKKDVLEQFVAIARQRQWNKEEEEVMTAYREVRPKDKPEEATMSREDAVKMLENNFKNRGSFFKDILKNFEETVVMADARNEVWNTIQAQKGKENLTTGLKVKRATVEQMGNNYDSYAKKVLKRGEMSTSERLNFEKSTVKSYRKKIASDNRVIVNTAKSYTENEIFDALKHDDVINVLLNRTYVDDEGNEHKLLEKNDDGTYSIKYLAPAIARKIGIENTANKQKRDYIPYSEVENVIVDLLTDKSKGIEASKADAKRLIKLCGFDYEGKNWAKILYDALIGTAIDAGSTVVTALSVGAEATNVLFNGNKGPYTATFDYDKTFPIRVNVTDNNHMEFLFTATGGAKVDKMALIKSLSESGLTSDNIKFENVENGFKMIIDKTNTTEVNVLKHIQETLTKEVSAEELGIDFEDVSADAKTKDLTPAILKGLLVGLGLNLLRAALKEQGELPVAVTQFDTTSLTEYCENINNSNANPKLKEALTTLAGGVMKKDADGNENWDHEAFKKLLNRAAGDKSFLNKFEFAILSQEYKPEESTPARQSQEKEPDAQPVTPKEPVVTPVQPTEQYVQDAEPEEVENKPNYFTKDKYGRQRHSWEGFVALYDPTGENHTAIVAAIKKANEINRSDNVIPGNLILPDRIGNFEKKTFDSDDALESYLFSHDKKQKRAKQVISHGANYGKHTEYRGTEQRVGDASSMQKTQNLYLTQDEAKKQAKGLVSRKKAQ